MRAELKESLANESRLRHEHAETIAKLKTDLALMSRNIDKATHDYNEVLGERSEAIDFEAKIHAVLRGKEVEFVGVGMVVKLQRPSSYPVIKSITAGGEITANLLKKSAFP